jgi:ABC-type proline/glycine betaine transport system ATPase subunit
VEALGAGVYVLEGGRVAQRGSVAELRAHPASDFVAEFVRA